jgi:dTDP-4-amino-4,6-dideoxygalactose transaminase
MSKIPFVDLKAQYIGLKSEMDEAIFAVIKDADFIGGKKIKDFEKAFGYLVGAKHVISCANGTDSLYIIMKSLGIGEGDEVITVANSWISSSETISQTGATPVFVDIDPVFLSIDINQLEQKITKNTKSVIAVHLHGQMADIEELKRICELNNLYLIEDCAQAHLSSYNGQYAGNFGIAGSFSFYPGKNLGAYGDAGCIITHDDDLAIRCRMFANHGALIKHAHLIEGINSRMDSIQAAVLNIKLPYLKHWTEVRRANANYYRSVLKNIDQIQCVPEKKNTIHSYHLFIIVCENRDALKQHLGESGIETAIHYPTPLPLLKAYSKYSYSEEQFPVASLASKKILSLPMYPELTQSQIRTIADSIQEFYAIKDEINMSGRINNSKQ